MEYRYRNTYSKTYTNRPVNGAAPPARQTPSLNFASLCVAVGMVVFSALPLYSLFSDNNNREGGLGAAFGVIKEKITENEAIAVFLGLDYTGVNQPGTIAESDTGAGDIPVYSAMSAEEINAAVRDYIARHSVPAPDTATGGSGASGGAITPSDDGVAADSGAGETALPLDGIVTSVFAHREDPFSTGDSGEETEFHAGVDIAAPEGTEIAAYGGGMVEFAGYSPSYGNYLIIDHGDFKTLYAHCSKLAAAKGDAVAAGDIVAYVGSTGRSTAPHLHFEVHIDGAAVDPMSYLKD